MGDGEAMIDSCFVLSSTGDVLIEKHWRCVTPRTVCDTFWRERTKVPDPQDLMPVITTAKHYLIHAHRFELFFLCVVQTEVPPLLVLEFIHRICDVLKDYLGEVREDVVKENFVLLYQLLDEMMDNGFPLTTEPNILKSMILPPTTLGKLANAVNMGQGNVVADLPEGTLSNVPWRKSGVKYSNNEIYFDIVEEIDCIIDNNGALVTCEVHGTIEVNCRLTGMPDLTLTFSAPEMMQDCSFHPCVRFGRWERERLMSFVPPDGNFQLVSYRVDRPVQLPIFVRPQISYNAHGGMVNISVGTKQGMNEKAMEDIKVVVPFPKCVSTVSLNASCGNYVFDDITKVLEWTVGKVPRDKSPMINGTISFPPDTKAPEESPVILVEFKIQGQSISNMKVDSLTVVNEKYKPYKGVRSITKAGKFQIRT